MFYIRLDKISAAKPGSSGIVFEMVLDNRVPRSADIFAFDFELWLLKDMSRSAADFLGKLSPDFLTDFSTWTKFGPHDQKPLNLIWHYRPRQLQQIEDWRKGSNPVFEIRGQVAVMSVWPAREGAAPAPSFSSFVWEFLPGSAGGQSGSYPLRFSFPQSEWAALLNQVDFRHITLYEFPSPPFPPAFSRCESRLKEAWEHHRGGRPDEAFLACRQAFECLGFDIHGDAQLSRRALLERMMSSAPARKRETVANLWESLQNVLNMGVHERGEPVQLSHSDTEMTLVCATALLGYLAKVK